MGDQVRDHLKQLESRAGITMTELQSMDHDEIDTVAEHCQGTFNNEDWLSAELEAMGDRFDRVEDTQLIEE